LHPRKVRQDRQCSDQDIKNEQATTKSDLRAAKKELKELQADVTLDDTLRDKLAAKALALKGANSNFKSAETARKNAETDCKSAVAALCDALLANDKVKLDLVLV
jgi:hypothetical protein